MAKKVAKKPAKHCFIVETKWVAGLELIRHWLQVFEGCVFLIHAWVSLGLVANLGWTVMDIKYKDAEVGGGYCE